MGIEVEHIGKALKQAREKKGFSQRVLAKRSGIPQSHISKIETIGVDITLTSLQALTRALDLELTLVPRRLIPAVDSLVRTGGNVSVRPAYTLDQDEDDG